MNTKEMLNALTPHVNNRNPITKKNALVLIRTESVLGASTSSIRVASSAFYYLETSIEVPKLETSEIKESFSANLHVLIRILRLCGKTFSVEYKNGTQAIISSGKDKYYLDTKEPSAYSNGKLPDVKDNSQKPIVSISLPYHSFLNLAKKSEPFATKDKSRRFLTSICVRQYKDRIRFLATDGRVVSDRNYVEEQENFNAVINKELNCNEIIIPLEVIKMLPKYVDAGNIDNVLLTRREKECRIESKNICIVWGLGDRQDLYPNVDKAFDGVAGKKLVMNLSKQEVLNAMIRASSIFGQDNCRVIMSQMAELGSQNDVMFQSKKFDNVAGYYEAKIPFDIGFVPDKQTYKGEYHFNGSILRNIVKTIEEDRINIVLHGNNEPMIIYPADCQETFIKYLLMPLRAK